MSSHHALGSVKDTQAALYAGPVERHWPYGLVVQINLHTVAGFEIHLMIAHCTIQLKIALTLDIAGGEAMKLLEPSKDERRTLPEKGILRAHHGAAMLTELQSLMKGFGSEFTVNFAEILNLF